MKKQMAVLKGQQGVSLIELLIVMTLVVIVLTLNTDTFGVIFRQSRQQTQAVGAQMDRVVGLEILRTDLEHAGFGLPWSFQGSINYSEATGSPQNTYNDAPSNPPRALVSGNDPTTFTQNNSDYLVIKSSAVGTNEASQRWTYIVGGQQPHAWNSSNLSDGDRVTVIWPRSVTGFNKELVMDGANFYTTYSSSSFPSAFSPASATTRFVIYGVDPDTNLRMPFNRADYYIRRPTTIPQACAPNTGILYKASINQSNGAINPEPLIDCVADMQIIYRLDTNNDGTIDSTVDDISGLSAQQIREQLREIRVYILSHEGQGDKGFRYEPTPINPHLITVGEFGLGRTVNLISMIGSGWQDYRWKVSTLVVKPKNLSG
jgi:prepilin-type N-terminal cleavage/methylation domain-containing protein